MSTERANVRTSPPRELMRLAIRTGGRIEGTVTRYDHERGGRVMELRVFWPDTSGYALDRAGGDRG